MSSSCLSSGFRKRPKRRGVVAVEFALIAPLFVALLLGIIEFGRMLMVQEILVNAAREGVRAAVNKSGSDTATVSTYMSTAGISGYSESCGTSGSQITVTVSVPCSTVSWLSSSTWFQGQTLSSSVTMMAQ